QDRCERRRSPAPAYGGRQKQERKEGEVRAVIPLGEGDQRRENDDVDGVRRTRQAGVEPPVIPSGGDQRQSENDVACEQESDGGRTLEQGVHVEPEGEHE